MLKKITGGKSYEKNREYNNRSITNRVYSPEINRPNQLVMVMGIISILDTVWISIVWIYYFINRKI
jgi:hypothetical protein